jgi:NAD(P)H-flavin reductase
MSDISQSGKQCIISELMDNAAVNREIFRLDFAWSGPAPKAGQFFLIKPERSSVFLARPVSIALWDPGIKNPRDAQNRKHKTGRSIEFLTTDTVRFLIARRGKGTEELAAMRSGERAELTGPLGNSWEEFLPPKNKRSIALVSGGIGIAPLAAFASELPYGSYDLYAGFRTMSRKLEEYYGLLGPAVNTQNKIIATEDGSEGEKGLIPDFLEPEKYRAVFACGPEPMLAAVASSCMKAGVPCYVSMERRMACGVGACLGCSVETAHGRRRCCVDGPVFPADEIFPAEKTHG